MKKIILLGWLLLSLLSTHAQARLFHIEILVFERTDNQYNNAERGSTDFSLSSNSTKRTRTIPNGNAYLLKPSAYSLRKKGFHILQLAAWQMNVKSKNHAPWYQLGDGNKLSGRVRISLSRYLHAEFDLTLKQSIQTEDGFGGQRQYHFKEHRRMRSRKLHYLDHPRMGILIEITPVKKAVSAPL